MKVTVGWAARGVALAGLASVQTSACSRQSARIEYSTSHVISAEDSAEVAAEKAAKVLPRSHQSAWMRLERTFFIHFGPNTFRGVEWGDGREDPSLFDPTALDAEQWIRAMKGAGGRLAILVSKHHDGFCMWPTRYADHSVVASPWLGGKGDVVRSAAEAARAHGLELGIYLSPADLYQLRTNPRNPGGYGAAAMAVRGVSRCRPLVHRLGDPAARCGQPSRRGASCCVS
jgi:alpha-L-fucosidase